MPEVFEPWLELVRTALPASTADYFPDENDPLDGLLQAPFSANAAVVRRLISTAASYVDLVVDPVAGAGSSGAAARQLGLPFYGVDAAPEMAAAATAKALGRAEHVREAAVGRLFEVRRLAGFLNSATTGEDLVVAAVAMAILLAAAGKEDAARERASHVEDALTTVAPPVQPSVIVCGDSTLASSWTLLPRANTAFVFASPPFEGTLGQGNVQPALASLAQLWRQAVGRVVPAAVSLEPSAEWTFDHLVRALRHATVALCAGLLLLEHEVRGERDADVEKLAHRLRQDLHLRAIQVFRTANFSGHGVLYYLAAAWGDVDTSDA